MSDRDMIRVDFGERGFARSVRCERDRAHCGSSRVFGNGWRRPRGVRDSTSDGRPAPTSTTSTLRRPPMTRSMRPNPIVATARAPQRWAALGPSPRPRPSLQLRPTRPKINVQPGPPTYLSGPSPTTSRGRHTRARARTVAAYRIADARAVRPRSSLTPGPRPCRCRPLRPQHRRPARRPDDEVPAGECNARPSPSLACTVLPPSHADNAPHHTHGLSVVPPLVSVPMLRQCVALLSCPAFLSCTIHSTFCAIVQYNAQDSAACTCLLKSCVRRRQAGAQHRRRVDDPAESERGRRRRCRCRGGVRWAGGAHALWKRKESANSRDPDRKRSAGEKSDADAG